MRAVVTMVMEFIKRIKNPIERLNVMAHSYWNQVHSKEEPPDFL